MKRGSRYIVFISFAIQEFKTSNFEAYVKYENLKARTRHDYRKKNQPVIHVAAEFEKANLQPVDQVALIPTENFVTDFLKLCKEYGVSPLPEFHIIATAENFKITSANSKIDDLEQQRELREESYEFSESKNKSKPELRTTLNLIYDDRVRLEAPKDLRCRGSEVNLFMLDALNNCVKKFTTLTTLKLQRCSINAFGIVQISEILAAGSTCGIKDLNLDGNSNIKQNYDLLCAPGTSLIYLSLKLCEINDDGVAKIASNLSHRDEPQAPKLIVLNLANNRISEIGGKFIGDMLRTNRSLQSLTLTGNRINDIGAENIIKQLSTFTLTEEEVVQKRRRKINRLKLCQEEIDNLSRETLKTEILEAEGKERGAGSRVSKKKRRSSSRQGISNSSESSVNRSTPIIVKSLEDKAEAMIAVDTHPLVKDVVAATNGTLTCLGNFKLQHLNLSFNKISEYTLRRLIDCVENQHSILNGDVAKGLQYVDVEGDEFEKSCDLVLQLKATIRPPQGSSYERNVQH